MSAASSLLAFGSGAVVIEENGPTEPVWDPAQLDDLALVVNYEPGCHPARGYTWLEKARERANGVGLNRHQLAQLIDNWADQLIPAELRVRIEAGWFYLVATETVWEWGDDRYLAAMIFSDGRPSWTRIRIAERRGSKWHNRPMEASYFILVPRSEGASA